MLEPGGTEIPVSFSTKQDGTATFALHNLEADQGPPPKPGYVASVKFTINSVTPEGGSPFVPSPAVEVTINEVQAPCV